nr:MBL fold metallo-hydrolase RNA specificity domain-containing protein [Ruficoccus amylovorans]
MKADTAFALSDHADYPELLEAVKQVNPSQVWTLHGSAADFADSLRQHGYQAAPLSQPDQLSLILGC